MLCYSPTRQTEPLNWTFMDPKLEHCGKFYLPLKQVYNTACLLCHLVHSSLLVLILSGRSWPGVIHRSLLTWPPTRPAGTARLCVKDSCCRFAAMARCENSEHLRGSGWKRKNVIQNKQGRVDARWRAQGWKWFSLLQQDRFYFTQ